MLFQILSLIWTFCTQWLLFPLHPSTPPNPIIIKNNPNNHNNDRGIFSLQPAPPPRDPTPEITPTSLRLQFTTLFTTHLSLSHKIHALFNHYLSFPASARDTISSSVLQLLDHLEHVAAALMEVDHSLNARDVWPTFGWAELGKGVEGDDLDFGEIEKVLRSLEGSVRELGEEVGRVEGWVDGLGELGGEEEEDGKGNDGVRGICSRVDGMRI